MARQLTLIDVQQDYMDTVNAGMARWGHRKALGHAARISRGARHAAEKRLRRLGFTDQQIAVLIKDARDMAELERIADA